MIKRIQWERKEQEFFVQWFKLKYPKILIAGSANGGTRNYREAANLKREGVLAGWPDIQIVKACKKYHGLFIEMKDPGGIGRDKGKLSMIQKSILNQLNAAGYYAVGCWGWLQAKEVANWYLEEKTE